MATPVIPLCAVSCRVYGQDGLAQVGARVTAKLNAFEVYQGYVVPQTVTGVTDTDGLCVLDLFPNELGSVESSYSIKITGTNGKTETVTAVVPNVTATTLESCAVLPVFPGKVDGQLALEAVLEVGNIAQTAANDAVNAKSDAESAAVNAGASAVAAATNETNASGYASAASTSATNASNSATAAATSATSAAGSATAAAGSASAAAASVASISPATIVRTTGDQSLSGIKTFTSAVEASAGVNVPAGQTGTKAPRADDIPSLLGIVGQMAFFATNTAPSGWIKANGAAYSRTAYAALFAVIGTTFGAGDGSTTFNVPDARGLALRGWDDSAGVDSGRVFGSTQADGIKQSTVNIRPMGSGFAQQWLSPTGEFTATTTGSTSSYLNFSSSGSGALSELVLGSATETRMKNLALLACIKY